MARYTSHALLLCIAVAGAFVDACKSTSSIAPTPVAVATTAARVAPLPTYLSAAALAASGRNDSAIVMLRNAVNAGFADPMRIERDSSWTRLRGEAAFAKERDRVREHAWPCLSDTSAKGLDFLVGDWDLRTMSGQTVQHTVIRKELANCALVQHDTVPNGYVAVAMHQWDRIERLWRQGYADVRGAFTSWRGRAAAARIEYIQDSVPGSAHRQRSTFWRVDSNQVRQVFEESENNGGTWRVTFDGLYVRRLSSFR